jgi:integrase
MSGGAGDPVRRIAGEILPQSVADLAAAPLAEALERAMKLARSSVSARTEQAYSDCWIHFSSWCESHGASYLPADPAIVGAYLAERAQSVGKSSLRISLAALAYYHRRSGHAWASNHPIIASVMKGILRQQKRPVRPAAALTSIEIKAMLRTCGDDPAGLRDKALLLTGFAGGLRRSELVALDVEDIRTTKDGMVLRIRSPKVDQEGQGADVGISHGSHPDTCPVRAMRTWLKRSGIKYGAVFVAVNAAGHKERRLQANGFWRILRSRAKLAGIAVPEGERLSSHGLRAGFITEAYLHGALDEQVMHHARQKNINTTRGYRQRAKVVLASPTKLLEL